MEKLLPIKFFEKRKIDEQLNEAGGSKDLPKWVLQGDGLTQHSEYLTNGVAQIAESFSVHKEEAHDLPLVIATTVSEKAIAKSYRTSIVDLLNSDNNSNVIGVECTEQPKEMDITEDDDEPIEKRRILSIVTSDALIANINKALKDTQNGAKLISSIAEMELFEAKTGPYNPENRVYRVRLIDYQDKHRNTIAQSLFKNRCHDGGISIDRETRYSSDMYLYRVSIDSADQMEAMQKIEGIFSIEEAVPVGKIQICHTGS